MVLFKYCKREHMDDFFSTGILRIGTLFDFRRDEHENMVHDGREGKVNFTVSFNEATAQTISDYPLLQRGFSMSEGAKVEGLHFINFEVGDADRYVFSCSDTYSREVHEKWLGSAGYDACYRIHSARLFFKAISAAIAADATFLSYDRVTYYDPNMGADARSMASPAAFKSDANFREQDEVRALWRPNIRDAIDVLLPSVPAAVKYCTPHARL